MDLQATAPSPDARAGPDLLNCTLQSQAGDVSAQVEEKRAGERFGDDGKVAGTARTESTKHASKEKQETTTTSPYSPVRRAPAKNLSSKTDTVLENNGIGLVFDIDFNKFQSPRPTPPPSREGKRTLAASSPRTARSRASKQSIKAPTTLAEACGLEASKPVAIHVES